ncbi:hypothetical protein F5887DRAFT_952300 [Amanita rubescens]|nr:hypothetical protein F5887DRAFT_952300 [Amanita rubescens]
MSAAHRRRHQVPDRREDDDNDDQPTPKLSAITALAAETPAARLRALLSRVPNNKPLLVPPRSDLLDSDLDTADDDPQPTSHISFARETLRDMFMHAMREPGDTPQKDKTLRPRRNSFDELDQRTRDRRSGRRKSLSDEELEPLPSDLQPIASGSQTMSIRDKLFTDSQTQLQDQSLPLLHEQSTSTSHNLNASQATPPAATSTPQSFLRKTQTDSNFPSQLDSQLVQSNLLDTDSEMQQAIENVESEGGYGSEFDHGELPFPPGHTDAAEPPTPPPGSTPSRSRIPLTRSRLNSLDKTYTGLGFQRRTSGEHRPVSRTSSISSSISFLSDEAERIRERERDWNKPKAPVRPSTPELKEGHRHGRFSSRMDSPMIGGSSSARRASINGADDLSSIGSQAEHHEHMAELDRERMHERERQWNRRLSHPSPNSLSRERTRTVSLTQIPRPESAMSTSSTTSLQRQHSFSPSGTDKRRMSSEPPGEYLHERERNWNAPRPRWLLSPEAGSTNGSQLTSLNGRQRADSLRSTGSSQDLDNHSPSHSRSQSYPHPNMHSPSRTRSKSDQLSQHPSPSPHLRSHTRSNTSPTPDSRPSSRNSLFKPTQIPTRPSTKSAQVSFYPQNHYQNGDPSLVAVDAVNHIQQETRADDGSRLRVELTPTIRTINPPPIEGSEEVYVRSHLARNESVHDVPLPIPKPQDSPPRNSRVIDTKSFLQTPPRPAVSNSTSFEFQSPSPPNGLPELPGPPSMSDEEEEDLVYDSIAWEQTPSQSITEHTDAGNVTAMKTPRPPGAWLATPAPADNVAHARESSTVTSETEYDGGLATPVASLSRGSALQTPAPPGAWVPTPATARKSILRVRFEQPPSESTETERSFSSANSETSDLTQEILKRSPSPANKMTQSSEPYLQMPVAKPQSPKSPRKSPKIRVMDAFGREAPDYISRVERVDAHMNTPRTRSAIRIVDPMGREVDGEANKVREDGQSLPSPLDRREALMRVRQGLSDLAEGIEEINRATADQVNEERIKELDELSQKSRTKREELATRLYTAETELCGKVPNVRDKNIVSDRRASWTPTGFIWVLLLILQMLLIFLMLRFATKQAKDIFLSTYYDPFYPDLHLYTIRPDTHHQVPSLSWISILDTLQRDGWKPALAILRDTVSIFIYDLRTRIWETWGETQPVASWPPT